MHTSTATATLPASTGFARKAAQSAAQSVQRLETIDLYRGLIMVIMLLDHTRAMVHREALTGDPLNVVTTTPLLYFTRWITHFCAPGFLLLAGASAGFQVQRGATISSVSKFLWTRGVVLILMEVIVVRLIVQFNADLNFIGSLQVIWAIGVSMMVLAALVHLPKPLVLATGLAIVVGHNAFDFITVPAWAGPSAPAPALWEKVWLTLHQTGFFPIGGSSTPIVKITYPVLPWIGLIAVGYVFADLWKWPAERRQRMLKLLAVGMALTFLALRSGNFYGDSLPWHAQDTWIKSAGSFMNLQKYPPSLLFLLATLAPSFLALAWLDRQKHSSMLSRLLIVYGKVPMFFYLVQWLWAHLAGILVTSMAGLPIEPYFRSRAASLLGAPAPTFGGSLVHVYVCWALGAILLFIPCSWYADLKRRRKDLVWLRYI